MGRHYTDVVAEARAEGEGLVAVERDGERALVTLNGPERLAVAALLTRRLT